MRRAILIGKVIDLNQVQTKTFADAIDGFAAGVFLVDGQGRLVHANASGQAMLDTADPLTLVQGVLVFSDEAANHALHEAFSAAGLGDEAVATRGIAVPLKSRAGEPFLAHILPLTSGMRREAGRSTSAVAALFVRRASIDLPTAINAAAQLYGFTPAEERVLRALIEVGGVAAVAAMLGAARSTVKRHVEHLFAKTGTKRQVELVRLIAGFDSPARPGK
jgi:DNA-binding CsgD family transcriptional regulator